METKAYETHRIEGIRKDMGRSCEEGAVGRWAQMERPG
jgi:hypothetical protein